MELTLLYSKSICAQWRDIFEVTTVEEAIKIPRELAFKKMRGFGPAGYLKLEEAAKALQLDVIPADHPKRISFRKNLIYAFNGRSWIGKLTAAEKSELVDDVLHVMAKSATSTEHLYNQDLDSEDQVQAFPMPWMNI